ncbi:hypothetical protein FRC01_003357, partial [Tulasnella sp. 417]
KLRSLYAVYARMFRERMGAARERAIKAKIVVVFESMDVMKEWLVASLIRMGSTKMPAIATVPHEIVLEITRLATLRDSIALLTTCKALYELYEARPFWMDQILRLKQRLNPLLSYHVGSLAIEELKSIARNPYILETAIQRKEVRLSYHGQLETPRSTDYRDARIVPGGRWLLTLSFEIDTQEVPIEFHPFLRAWSIGPPVPNSPHCVASLKLRPDSMPLELCLQPGNSASDLLVLVNCFLSTSPSHGSYLQVLHIDMADESPQFTLLAHQQTDRFCSGMGVEGQNLVATFSNQGRDFSEALIWDWRCDENVSVRSPNAAGMLWFMAVSRDLITAWNSDTRCIEVHEPSPSGAYERVRNHAPRSTPHQEDGETQSGQSIVSTVIEPWNSSRDLDQVALAHLEEETLRIDMENLGAGRIRFTSYPKDNTYMQDPHDVSSPYGNGIEVLSDCVRTASDHLLDLSFSGRLTLYLTPEGGSEVGECISYGVYDTELDDTTADGLVSDERFAFICPFSGIVGSVSEAGHLFIWQLEL